MARWRANGYTAEADGSGCMGIRQAIANTVCAERCRIRRIRPQSGEVSDGGGAIRGTGAGRYKRNGDAAGSPRRNGYPIAARCCTTTHCREAQAAGYKVVDRIGTGKERSIGRIVEREALADRQR